MDIASDAKSGVMKSKKLDNLGVEVAMDKVSLIKSSIILIIACKYIHKETPYDLFVNMLCQTKKAGSKFRDSLFICKILIKEVVHGLDNDLLVSLEHWIL